MVKINTKYSLWKKVKNGIPQGSIGLLEPLLFIIYVNDIFQSCSSGSRLFVYADDENYINTLKHQMI